MGQLYPTLRDNFGMELYIGNHPGMEGDHSPCASKLCEGTGDYTYADFPTRDPRLFAELGEVAFMEQKLHEAVAYIRAEPGKFVWRSAKRLASFWLLPSPLVYFPLVELAWIGARRCTGPLRKFLLIMFAAY